MNLLRAAARTMLAGYFVVNGVKALKDPTPYAPDQERFAHMVVPLARKAAPEQVASAEDAETLARISGGLQVAGGVAMVLGKARRLGAGLIALSMVPQVMGFSAKGLPAEQKAAARDDLLKNVALLGGAMIAAGDTEGRPGLAWRAQDSAAKLSRNVGHTRQMLGKDAELTKLQLARSVDRAKNAVTQPAKGRTR